MSSNGTCLPLSLREESGIHFIQPGYEKILDLMDGFSTGAGTATLKFDEGHPACKSPSLMNSYN